MCSAENIEAFRKGNIENVMNGQTSRFVWSCTIVFHSDEANGRFLFGRSRLVKQADTFLTDVIITMCMDP